MSPLFHCIYASTAVRDFNADELCRLLQVSRANNERLGVTGILLYTEGSFFQVLEGAHSVIDSLYLKLQADERHRNVIKIIQEPIPRRFFSDWSMGCSIVSRQQLCEINGVNDFFRDGFYYGDLDSGRARKLLDAFRQGRWRANINNADSAAIN
jgi:hypothetical protein